MRVITPVFCVIAPGLKNCPLSTFSTCFEKKSNVFAHPFTPQNTILSPCGTVIKPLKCSIGKHFKSFALIRVT
jgi:hypothetical protein